VTELGRLLTLHEYQSNLLDPEKLVQIGTVLAKQVSPVIRTALSPEDPDATAGTLTSSPATSQADLSPRAGSDR
jgi:hypothetical protein